MQICECAANTRQKACWMVDVNAEDARSAFLNIKPWTSMSIRAKEETLSNPLCESVC